MQILIPDYSPSPKQEVFHTSPAFETLFGGAAGPGKTAALCAEMVTAALEAPNTNVYCFRKTLVEVKLSIHPELMKQLAPYNNHAKNKIEFNGQDQRWKFPNGSFIQYAYCQYDGDVHRYQSAEMHTLAIDELTHFKQEWYEYFKTRVRGKNKRLRVLCASNPGNIGHGWVKKYFVDRGDQKLYTDPETGVTRLFIKAIIDDHPDPDFRAQYAKRLDAIQNPQLRKALRHGDWSVFEGQVFMEWDERIHVVDQLPQWEDDNGNRVSILAVSQKYGGYDLGYRDPGALYWIARAPENEYGVRHYYVYREIYEQWRNARQWAEDVRLVIDTEPLEYLVLPHDCFAIGHGASKSVADVFNELDIPVARANSLSHGAKMHRIDIMHQLLSISPDGKPYLMIHKSCQNLIRTIPNLPYSSTRPEEIDANAEDHPFDAVTYGLMVIDDPETWLVSAKAPQPEFKQTPYEGTPEGQVIGQGLDLGKVLTNAHNVQRDWRNS